MERITGDPVNKAFEAFKQASIEKESAKRELQEKTEYYKRYTHQLEQQIEDQNKLITKLEAQLSSAAKLASGETSQKSHCPALQKQEVGTLSPYDHHTDQLQSCSHQRLQMRENTDTAEMPPNTIPGTSSVENKDVLDMFRELQGDLQLIQALTGEQTDHLSKLCRRNSAENEWQFSMPIQCTDVTAERAEGPLGPFSSAAWSGGVEEEPGPVSLPSGDMGLEEGDFLDSLTGLSVRFPPSADSEYEFLNSAVEKPVTVAMRGTELDAISSVPMVTEEESLELPVPLPRPHSGSASTSLTHEGICGPRQPLWSPELCDPQQTQSPGHCYVCNALIPLDNIYRHLNSHFQSETSNGH
ncbi:hypothetical protein AAFF_G00045360 [Aldrovandia affinis]|uniref:Tbk1/Ikki binding domain-containing protein n=1 Tax=Aldrovandia affinis TaxID=143900 RepID=A0AAD7WEV5_9TELE|nr:hypothetical protein AAFF_G00045360 [Aldrovandia affinis]